MKTLDTFGGEDILQTIAMAIEEAKRTNDTVRFDFNGVNVIVAGDSNPDLIYRDCSRGMSGYLGDKPTVGPYPWLVLSDAILASDAKIKAENASRAAEFQAKYNRQTRDRSLVLQGALGNAGSLELSDTESWAKGIANNTDGYGARVFRYAEEWGRLMQVRIASGETVAECAEELSRIADDDGITGFMYGCAVGILAKCWKHGEELRRWHNKETQIGTEGDEANKSGGVLNPAVLIVNRK